MLNSKSHALAFYNSFPAFTHFRTNLLEEFLVGDKLKFLSSKVHAHLIHNLRLAHSQMIKNTP